MDERRRRRELVGVPSSPLRFNAAAPAASGGTVVGPATGAVARSANGGLVWSQTRLSTVYVTGIAVDPVRPLHVFATTVNGDHALWESSDGGATWRSIDVASGVTAAFAVAIDPGSPGTIFVQQADGLYRSTDGGDTWQPRTDTGRTQLEVNPKEPGTLYAGELISHDGGGSWDIVGGSTPGGVSPLYSPSRRPRRPSSTWAPPAGCSARPAAVPGRRSPRSAPAPSGAVAVNPANAGDVYAASGSSVFHRSGGTFAAVHALPDAVQALAVDPLHAGVVYASTGGAQAPALYRSADSGASWQRLGGGASGAQVPTLTVTPAGVLMAGTIGRACSARGHPCGGCQAPRCRGSSPGSGWARMCRCSWRGARCPVRRVRRRRADALQPHDPRRGAEAAGAPDGDPRCDGARARAGRRVRAGHGVPRRRRLRGVALAPLRRRMVDRRRPRPVGGRRAPVGQGRLSARFSFTGRGVAWVATRGPSRGTARVYLDGKLAGTVNLRAGERQTRMTVFVRNFSTTRTHSIGIVVTGGTVDLDAVTVLH